MTYPSPGTEPKHKNKLRFEGRVLPEVRQVTIPTASPIGYSDPWGFHGEIDIAIVDGKITIDCTCFDAEPRIEMCIARSFECATALVDLFAFTKGWSLSVMLDRMIDGATVRLIATSELSLQPLATSIANDDDFRAVWDVLLKRFNLKFALHDLITGIGSLNYPHIGAARSVEAIRDLIAPTAPDEKTAWAMMRSLLNVDRGYLQRITDASRDPRHGKRGGVTGNGQLIVMQRGWAIMNRYLEFMKRGGERPLPSNEFPALTD